MNSKKQYELDIQPESSTLWNHDLRAIPIFERSWTKWHVAALWVAMCISITTYMLGSSLIGSGMNWWQSIMTVCIANIIVLVPMLLIASPGTKYGIAFPVLARSSFGTEGAKLAATFRAIVGCGWFGIQTCIGGKAIYLIICILLPQYRNMPKISWIGLSSGEIIGIAIFLIIQITILYTGIQGIKKVEVLCAPLLLFLGILLLFWAFYKVGSINKVLSASEIAGKETGFSFWLLFWPALTANIGYWATLSLNIPDFMRFVRSQKDQVIGQSISLPTTMTLFSFIGISVTSATIFLYGKAIWDPIDLVAKFGDSYWVILPLIGLIIATLCCNIAANLVAPANDFSNLLPKFISFKTGGVITAVIAIAICPWKLIADPTGYIFKWLVAYSSLLGAVAGIMICDYYVIRRKKLNLKGLYDSYGEYRFIKGWNPASWSALIISIIPNIPGFLTRTNVVPENFFPNLIAHLYDYAWFISFVLSFIFYYIFMKMKRT